ncbi:hypothetical protein EMIT013CA1_10459 [Bacillus sp. IT-13CA1]
MKLEDYSSSLLCYRRVRLRCLARFRFRIRFFLCCLWLVLFLIAANFSIMASILIVSVERDKTIANTTPTLSNTMFSPPFYTYNYIIFKHKLKVNNDV